MKANINESIETDKTICDVPNKTALEKEISDNTADDKQLMQNILIQISDLTDEINQLRKQLEDINNQKINTQLVLDENSGESTSNDVLADDEVLKCSDKSEKQDDSSGNKKKKNKAVTILSNIVFYTLILSLVFGAFLVRSSKGGRPWMIGGYSAMTVLTGSMEDVYPQGSLIITKSVDADKLKIGDDITYMTGETSSITHRIIGITENYLETGERGFETKGVMNSKPDSEIVAASNVVGRVVFCSKTLGDIAKFITSNWPFLLFFIIIIILLLAFLKWNGKKTDKKSNTLNKTKN